MKYDLFQVLLDIDGSPAVDDGKPATYQTGLMKALILDPPAPLSATEKLDRFKLLRKIQKATAEEPIEFTVDELKTLKDAANIYTTLTYGQLVTFLNQSN